MHLIRKISIGKDYKNDAMHYAVGQEVYGGHTIDSIIEEEKSTLSYIKRRYLYALERLQQKHVNICGIQYFMVKCKVYLITL